jgi:6-phosphogluconolactonase (cycloisomerase 2 family)
MTRSQTTSKGTPPVFQALEPRLLLNGTIEGQVWEDINGNGLHDAGELGLNGSTVELVDQSTDVVVASTVTSAMDLDGSGTIDPITETGLYQFSAVAPGHYDVRAAAPAGWLQASPVSGVGELTLLDYLGDEPDEMRSYGTEGFAFSQSGEHVYVANGGSSSLHVFQRDSITGELSLLQSVHDGVDGVDLSRPRNVLLSPDGRHVYVPANESDSISIFERDLSTGILSLVGTIYETVDRAMNGPSYGSISSDGKHLYLPANDAICVYQRDEATGWLTPVATITEGTGSSYHTAVSPDGAHVYSVDHSADAVNVLQRDSATGLLTFVQTLQKDVDGVDGLDWPAAVTVSPDGLQVFIASYGSASLTVLDRDPATGEVSPRDVFRYDDQGEYLLRGTRYLSVSEDGANIYVTSTGDHYPARNGTLVVFSRDPASGEVAVVEVISETPMGLPARPSVTAIGVSPDGRHVYAGYSLYSSSKDGIATYARDYPTVGYGVMITSDEAVNGLASGMAQSNSLAGQVFNDLNLNGLRDPGEIGLSAWTVQVTNPANGVIAEAVTSDVDLDGDGVIDPETESGLYGVEGLLPGDYEIRLAMQSNWLQTAPAGAHVVSLNRSDLTGVDFALAETTILTGQVFYDRLGDGSRDVGEEGLNGWTIELVDVASASVVATTVSADDDLDGDGLIDADTESGLYRFELTQAGDYEVRQVVPPFWTVTDPAGGAHAVTAVLGQSHADLDFGNLADLGSVQGQVFDDLNANGLRDGGESSLNGWTVELIDADTGAILATTTTADDDLDGNGAIDPVTETGLYSFTDLAAANYQVAVIAVAGWMQVAPSGAHVVALPADGPDVADLTFAVARLGSISGQIFADRNADGLVDVGDFGLNDWVIELIDMGDGSVVATTVTVDMDSDGDGAIDRQTEAGRFRFDGLVSRNYQVRQTAQSGWTATVPSTGMQLVLLGVGEDREDVHLGNIAAGDIEGRLTEDLDGNGSADAGEPGLNGWTVELVDVATGTVAATTLSADVDRDGNGTIDPATESGWYVFSNIVVGDYDVRQVLPAGWQQSTPAGPTGEINYVQSIVAREGYFQALAWAPTDMAISPDGRHAYGVHRNDRALTAYSRNPHTGELTLEQVTYYDGINGLHTAEVVTISPDGQYVYTATGQEFSADLEAELTVFRRDSATGHLTFLQTIVLDTWTHTIGVTPDSQQVFVQLNGPADLYHWRLLVFDRDPATGALSESQQLTVPGDHTAWQMAASGDGTSVYVAGEEGLVALQKDAFTGDWAVAQTIPPRGARSILVSPNGEDVYVGGFSGMEPVSWYRRDAATGLLTFVQSYSNGQDGIDGLGYPEALALSVDGRFLFVACSDVDTLVAFERDPATGELSFFHTTHHIPDALDGLDYSGWMMIDPAGRHLYLGAYFPTSHLAAYELAAAGLPRTVRVDAGVIVSGVDFGNLQTIGNVSGRIFDDADGLGGGEAGPGLDGWTVELRDPTTGYSIARRVTESVDLDGNGTIEPLTESGLYSFADLWPGDYDLHMVLQEGYSPTTPIGDRAMVLRSSDADVLGQDFGVYLSNPAEVTGQVFEDLNADGQRQANEPGLDGVTVELIDGDGAVVATTVTASVDLDGDGVIDAQTERGLYAFAGIVPGDYVVRQAASGDWVASSPVARADQLALQQVVTASDVSLVGAQAGTLSPDGRYLYVAGVDALTVYERNQLTGELVVTQVIFNDGANGIDNSYGVAVSPDGLNAYVVGDHTDTLSIFARDTVTGRLTWMYAFQGDRDGIALDGARGLLVDDDGEHVYVSSRTGLLVFDRDAATGELTLRQTVLDDVDGVEGIGYSYEMRLSPDGNHLYVVSWYDNALVGFDRDTVTGELTFRQVVYHGTNGNDCLYDAMSLAISPDGRHVYVGAEDYSPRSPLGLFERDTVTGELTFVRSYRNGDDGVSGLGHVQTIALSPDGRYVYAGPELVQFERDLVTGELSFLSDTYSSPGGETALLDYVRGIIVSQDGRDVYVPSYSRSAVNVFHHMPLAADHALSLAADEAVGADFGRYQLISSVGGTVFFDNDTNGQLDPGEGGIATTVHLVDVTTGQVVAQTTSAADGLYAFQDVRPGGYELTVDLSDRYYIPVTPVGAIYALDLASGDEGSADFDFGFLGAGVIGGRVFADHSADGNFDGSDFELVGWTIEAEETTTGDVFTTTSEADGTYELASLPAGTYEIRQILQAGWSQTAPLAGAYVQALTTGQAAWNLDFGNTATGDVEGRLIEDLNGDGQSDVTEPGLNGWTVELVDAASGAVIGTATTGDLDRDGDGVIDPVTETGWYVFSGMPVGDYVVRPTVFSQWILTSPGADGAALGPLQVLRDQGDTFDSLDYTYGLSIAPDGRSLYVATWYEGAAITLLDRDVNSGELSLGTPVHSTGESLLYMTRHTTVSPDGRNLYVADPGWSGHKTTFHVYTRDPITGELALLQVVDGGDGPQAIAVSPDGLNVYAVREQGGYSIDDGLEVFTRDPATGELVFQQLLTSRLGTAYGLGVGLSSIIVSNDGRNVYVSNGKDDTLAIFQRDLATGDLTFLRYMQDGWGIDHLESIGEMVISPDGRHVYAVAEGLIVFERDIISGDLTFVESTTAGQMDWPGDVAISADGRLIFAVSNMTDTLSVFGRDESTGRLSLLETFTEGVDGVDGLAGAHEVVVSPDGRAVYILGQQDDAVAVFQVLPMPGERLARLVGPASVQAESIGAVRPVDTIAGHVFDDADADGAFDAGEVGLEGWTVELIDTTGGYVVATAATAAGQYVFANVAPGDYEIRAVIESGYVATAPAGGTVTLTIESSGPDQVDLDLGMFLAHPAEVNGQIFEDVNGNGVQDAGENGLDGRTVELIDADTQTVAATAVTVSDDLDENGVIDPATESGLYVFDNLPPRDYQLRQLLPDATWGQTTSSSATGEISYVATTELPSGYRNAPFLSPDGGHAYVMTHWSTENHLLVYQRDPVTGELTAIEQDILLPRDTTDYSDDVYLAVSPDGQFVYVSTSTEADMWVYQRDSASGRLTLIQSVLCGNAYLAVSADSEFVYAASSEAQGIVVLQRDPVTGLLSEVQRIGYADYTLCYVRGLEISPDGRTLYVCAAFGSPNSYANEFLVFDRNDATGELTLIQSFRNSPETPMGGYLTGVAVTHDGRFVYLTSFQSSGAGVSTINLFSRDLATGRLTPITWYSSAYDGLSVINSLGSLTITPDDAQFIIKGNTGYRPDYGVATLVVFDIDPTTGELSLNRAWDELMRELPDMPDWTDGAAISPDGRFYYISATDNRILALQREMLTGSTLSLAPDASAVVNFGTAAVVSSVSGQIVHDDNADGLRDAGEMGLGGYAVQLYDADAGMVRAVAISGPVDLSGDGLIDPETEWGAWRFENVLPGDYEIRLAVAAEAAQTYPAGSHVISLISGDVAAAGIDFGVVVTGPASIDGRKFEDRNANGLQDAGEEGLDGWTIELLDADTGRVIASRVTTSVDVDGNGVIDAETESGLYGFTHLIPASYIVREVRQDGWRQTVPMEVAGDLTFVGSYHSGDDGAVLNGSIGVARSPDNRHLYVPGFYGNAITIYSCDSESGVPAFVGVLTDSENGLELPYAVAFSPDGHFAYIANVAESYLMVYQRDATTGELSFVQRFTQTDLGHSDGNGARNVLVSHDGMNVYTITSQGASLGVFSRDQATGRVTLLQVLVDNVDGELFRPQYLTMSGDGRHVYVTAHDSLSVFQRDLASGELTGCQVLSDGVDGVDGLDNAVNGIVSPDGRHVYVTAYYDNSVSLFSRNEVTGQLTFVIEYHDGLAGIDGLYRPGALTMTPDGKYVMVAGRGENSLVVFRRDNTTGELTLLNIYWDDQGGITGLDQPADIVISADGRDVYVRGYYEFSHFRNEYVDNVYRFELAADQTVTADFANVMLNIVAGQVIGDANNDGQTDVDEIGMDGWFVELVDAATSDVIDAAMTASVDLDGNGLIDPVTEGGIYAFAALPGDYELRLVLQGEWDQTFPAGPYVLSLDRSHLTDLDFGVFLGANVSGQVFADRHINGVQDPGDIGMDGWTIELIDAATGVVLATTTTASVDLNGDAEIDLDTEAGLYVFDALLAGTYEVRQIAQFGWMMTAPPTSVHTVSLAVGEDAARLDFGNIAWGDIEGQVFDDLLGDGIHDALDVGIDGWAIELVDAATGEMVATTTSASIDLDGNGVIDPATESGWYAFTHVPVAVYDVRQQPATGYVQTLPGPVSVFGAHEVTATANAVVGDVDFGVFAPAIAEGQVFADVNYDGLRDLGEAGLNGWTVELVDADAGLVTATVVSEDVDENDDGVIDPQTESGRYVYTGVLPGNYEIRMVLPELWSQTYPEGPGHAYVPLSGIRQDGIDFGVASLPSIGGQVFKDYDGSGTHDLNANEVGLNSWTIELVDAATGEVLATATTADRDVNGDGTVDPVTEGGSYRFTDLLPGDYLVRQIDQNGWIRTLPISITYSFSMNVADHETGADFGNYQPRGLSGQKWHDLDGDGLRDEGEPGISGWTIEVVDAVTGQVVASTVTGNVDLNRDGLIDPITEAGLYSIIGLPAGDYEVREVQQAGWVQTWREALDVRLRVSNAGNFLYDLETFTYYPYWLEGAHTDFNRDPGLWKVNNEVYNNGDLDRWTMPQYTPGLDPNVYWFIFEDARTGEDNWQSSWDKDFNDFDIKVVKDPAAGTVELTGYHRDSGYGFALIEPDGTVHGEAGGQIAAFTLSTAPVYGPHSWTFNLASDQSLAGLDFSNFEAGAVTGRVFHDVNGNGVRDLGEVGLDGQSVQAIDPATGQVIDTAITESLDLNGDGVIHPVLETGVYVLSHMPVGEFEIQLVPADGWTQTSPMAMTYAATVTDTSTITAGDFGAAELGIISGQVFGDANGNHVRDGIEVGIDDWTLELVDQATGAVVATTTSASADVDGDGWVDPATERGGYVFTGVAAGDYEVRQIAPAGWAQTSPIAMPVERTFAAGTDINGDFVIVEFDPTTGAIVNSFAGPQPIIGAPFQGLAVGPDSLFYVDAVDTVSPVLWELDMDTGAVIDSDVLTYSDMYFMRGMAYLDGLLYIHYKRLFIAVWDPVTDTLVDTLSTTTSATGNLAAAPDLGVLFDATPTGDIVTIDPATGAILSTFSPGVGPLEGGLAYAKGELLAVDDAFGEVIHRIDPLTGTPLGSFTLGTMMNVVGLAGDMPNPAVPVTHSITLGPDEIADDLDFGNRAPAVPADFNGDGLTDSLDIDLLFANLGDAAYDLDGDGDADTDDVDFLIHDILNTEYGDANLDGLVDAIDLAIFKAGFSGPGGWGQGNFNVDGLVNITDLSILSANFGFERPAEAAPIGGEPAPAAMTLSTTNYGSLPQPPAELEPTAEVTVPVEDSDQALDDAPVTIAVGPTLGDLQQPSLDENVAGPSYQSDTATTNHRGGVSPIALAALKGPKIERRATLSHVGQTAFADGSMAGLYIGQSHLAAALDYDLIDALGEAEELDVLHV